MLIRLKINWITHLIKILAFRCVAKAKALWLNIICFRTYDAGRKGLVVKGAVIAFRIIFNRHLPVAGFREFQPIPAGGGGQSAAHAPSAAGEHLGTIHPLAARSGQIDKQEAAEILGRHPR